MGINGNSRGKCFCGLAVLFEQNEKGELYNISRSRHCGVGFYGLWMGIEGSFARGKCFCGLAFLFEQNEKGEIYNVLRSRHWGVSFYGLWMGIERFARGK